MYCLLTASQILLIVIKKIKMIEIQVLYNLKEQSTLIQGTGLWKCLEAEVKNARFIYIFKGKIKVHF